MIMKQVRVLVHPASKVVVIKFFVRMRLCPWVRFALKKFLKKHGFAAMLSSPRGAFLSSEEYANFVERTTGA